MYEEEDFGMQRRDDVGDQTEIKEVHNSWWKLSASILDIKGHFYSCSAVS